ncbi:procollagen lysyl hydroxylase [Rhodnius prolixus]|uniref:procollagen-lysine 5-dioxygenase n=2 Tax=Rhodnius TaxID=13248 RepID=T1I002_RHOPR
MYSFSFLLLTVFLSIIVGNCEQENDFIVFTVATDETDGYKRFMRSAEVFDIPVEVLGMHEKWEGGNMNYRGGGHKVNLLRRALEPYKDNANMKVMFTDSYDVIFLGDADQIVNQFLELDSRLVFSAEVFCWPDEHLASQYPVTESPYKYLNSGGLIGYAKDLYELLDSRRLKNKDDDQLYYTNLFLDKGLREKYRMRLDHKAKIFQNINGAENDLKLDTDVRGSSLENILTGYKPLVLHGNGPRKLFLNSLGNYLAYTWDSINGCGACNGIEIKEKSLPVVQMSIFVTANTPFMNEFLEKVNNISYPKKKIHVFLYNNAKAHMKQLSKWVEENSESYSSFKQITPVSDIQEANARNLAIDHCVKKGCAYYFNVDSVAHLDNPEVLKLLIKADRGVIAPLLVRPYKAWSNFWGSINLDGFYARSFDYMDIVNRDKRGIWNVPYITHSYLVNATLLDKLKNVYTDPEGDPDMTFCKHLRNKGIFMFVDNHDDYGHLVDPESFNPGLVNPELYEVISNQRDWEQRYLHPNFSQSLQPDNVLLQPCPDVYWFPVVTPRFCKELIEIMEAFGKWSAGSNYDERLKGGYENVPTRDIHMNQVGLERQWLYILQQYIRPLQERVFLGYYHDPPNSLMNFVVRYKPDEQPSLRPHHDSSTYTINIALNRPKIDYTGGGCHFIRYNCSVTDTKVGWTLMHPGRLTHYHEGLRVTSGTRYIMISFVDP